MNYTQKNIAQYYESTELQTKLSPEITITIPENKRKVSSLLDPRLEAIREKLHITPSISANEFLSFIDQGKPELRGRLFGGKIVLDLGGGFGGLPWLLKFYAKHITVVDPIFADDHGKEQLDSDLLKIAARIDFVQERLKTPNLDEFVHGLLKKNELESEKIYEETKRWKSYNPETDRNITRNSSFGENLEGIADHSQDVIFLNHVITKDTVRIPELFAEIERVLAPNGRLFISNVNDAEERRIIDQMLDFTTAKWNATILEEGKFFIAELRK